MHLVCHLLCTCCAESRANRGQHAVVGVGYPSTLIRAVTNPVFYQNIFTVLKDDQNQIGLNTLLIKNF